MGGAVPWIVGYCISDGDTLCTFLTSIGNNHRESAPSLVYLLEGQVVVVVSVSTISPGPHIVSVGSLLKSMVSLLGSSEERGVSMKSRWSSSGSWV